MGRSHVFVYRIGALGDTLVSLPAIRAIAHRHPDAPLTLITNPASQPGQLDAWHVLKHTGLFENVLYLAPRLRPLFSLVSHVRMRPGSTLYYLPPARTRRQFDRDRFVFESLCGCKEIVGMNRTRSWASSGLPRSPDGSLIRLEPEWARLLRVAGLRPEDVPAGPLLAPPAAAESKVLELLAPLRGRPLIGVGPGSKMPAKRWFLDRFEAVLRRAVEAWPDLGVVILGGPEDAAAGDQIASALPEGQTVNLAGKTNIVESAAACAKCVAYLGNDTGTMHLAASMDVPCVGIFTSRANPGMWDPWGEAHAVLRRDLPCSGCMLTECHRERMRCLDLISVDDVSTALHGLLGDALGTSAA